MFECSGRSYFSVSEAVTGRLWQSDKQDTGDGCAKILLWNGKGELPESLLSGAVGLVLTGGVEDEALREATRLAEFCRLPALRISDDAPALKSDVKESIAILDTSRHKLFVNPDLETINLYFGSNTRKSKSNISVSLEIYSRAANISVPQECESVALRGAPSVKMSEEEYYEYLCDVADANTGTSLIALAELSAGEEGFLSHVRAIYRASVWGRFSLLCEGIRTPEQASECISLLHRAFCMLDSEGREFNGFIAKGMLIDTPLMLLSRPKHRMIDNFTLDLDRLRYLLTSSKDASIGEKQTADMALDFAKRAAGVSVSLRGLSSMSDQALTSLLHTNAFDNVFVSESGAERVNKAICLS